MQSAIESWVARALGSIAERCPTKPKSGHNYHQDHDENLNMTLRAAGDNDASGLQMLSRFQKAKKQILRFANDEGIRSSIARAVSVGCANGLLSFVIVFGQRSAHRFRQDAPRPFPIMKPTIASAYWSTWRGFHSELLNEALIKCRGPQRFRSNAFLSGAIFGLWDARQKSPLQMLKHSARAGGQELLVATIFGAANPAHEFEGLDDDDDNHEDE